MTGGNPREGGQMNKRNFDIKLDAATIKIARLALLSAGIETKGRGAIYALQMASAMAGTVSMDGDEAATLQMALSLYAEREVREGSDSHKIATQFSAALGDFVATKVVTEVRPALKQVRDTWNRINSKTVGGSLPTANDVFERRMKEKRDEIFRDIVGRPEELSIWGTPKIPTDEPVTKRIPANRVVHLEGVVNTVPGGAVLQHAPTIRTRLSPIADVETDQALTGGAVPTHNEQMKREGTEILMVNKNRAAGSPCGQGTVVGSVSSYERKLQDAQNSGDTVAEVNLLSTLWEQ